MPSRVFCFRWLSGGWQNRCCLTEKAHQALDVLGHRGQEELLPHELQSPQAQATQPDLMLEFREQGFHLLSLPLGMGEFRSLRQLSCPLSGGFIHVDGKIAKRPAGALRFECTRAASFARPDVGISAIPLVTAAVVENLARGTDIAIVLGLVPEMLGTKKRAVLSVDAVAGPHVGSYAAIGQPLQELPVPIRGIGRH